MPFVVAQLRNHKRTVGIFILNLLFGWTGIGWIMLLTYALLSEAKEK
jgi:TM2 domain-containing membrane protein YozV